VGFVILVGSVLFPTDGISENDGRSRVPPVIVCSLGAVSDGFCRYRDSLVGIDIINAKPQLPLVNLSYLDIDINPLKQHPVCERTLEKIF